MSLDHGAASHAIGVGLQVFHLSNQQKHLEQFVDVFSLDGTHRHHHHIAAPVFRQQALLGEFLLHPIRRCSLLVDLVDRDHDRHFSRAGVADGLQGLGTDAIIRRHNQNRYVGHLGAARSHGREGFVARRIQEGELAGLIVVFDLDLIGTDVLGDATGLAGSHPGLSDGIQQAGFAVVDVAHHRHDGGASDQVSLVGLLDHLDGLLSRFLDVVLEDRNPEFLGHRLDRAHVQRLGDRGDDPFEEQGFDDLGALDTEHVRQLLHREVVLRHNDHFRPHLLGFPGCPQFHGTAALTLPRGFLAAFAHRRNGFGCLALLGSGLGGTSQARRQHHILLLTGKTTGLCRQGIIVFTDDVNLLALTLRRTAAQGFQFGAVIPVGASRPPLATGPTGAEPWSPWC